METDFVPNFIFKSQIGELVNEESIMFEHDGNIVVSHNNHLNIFDTSSKEIIKRIGIDKKETISAACISDDTFVLGYNCGVVRAINSDNIKIFGFKLGNRKITSLFYVNGLLLVSSATGRIIRYDMVKNAIAFEYERMRPSQLPIGCNENYFVYYANRRFFIFSYDEHHPVFIHSVLDDIIDFCVGRKTLVFLSRNGEVCFFDLDRKCCFENKLHIKKTRSIVLSKNRLYVITSKKVLYWYEIDIENNTDMSSNANNEVGSVLNKTSSCKIKDMPCIDLDARKITVIGKNIYASTLNNKIVCVENHTKKTTFMCYHKNEIISVKICGNIVFTLSVERLIKWRISKNAHNSEDVCLELSNSKNFEFKTIGMCFFNNLIVLCDHEGLSFYSIETLEKQNAKSIKGLSSINSGNGFLGVAKDNVVMIFDKALKTTCIITDEADVVYFRFSNDDRLVGISNYNNKINVYKLENKEMIISLYGHSLPVRLFDFSADNTSIISCSADKLVKLWGTEFGECRKTHIINAHCVMFMKHNHDLFLASQSDIHYYKRNVQLKKYKNYDIRLLDMNDDYLVAIGKYNICLYEIDKYELIQESSSDSENSLEIENTMLHDKFSKALEKVKEDGDYDYFFRIFKQIDLGDINNIISYLDDGSLLYVLNVLEKNINYSTALSIKIFSSIVDNHKAFVMNSEHAYRIYKKLFDKVVVLKELIEDNIKRENASKML